MSQDNQVTIRLAHVPASKAEVKGWRRSLMASVCAEKNTAEFCCATEVRNNWSSSDAQTSKAAGVSWKPRRKASAACVSCGFVTCGW
ncbi:hypothetical protein GQ600_972 [Phytophthora cactorum]|nr:hypothetical protein GQ600_972 [Phytophthora cactorum]